MSETESIEKIIPILVKNLGLKKTEAKVLLPIYLGGNMTVGTIALLSGFSPKRVEQVCNTLLERELVTRIDGIVPIYRALPPSLSLVDALSEIVGEINKISNNIESTIEERLDGINSIVEQTIDSRKMHIEKIQEQLLSYEENTTALLQKQIQSIVKATESLLTQFITQAELKMQNFESHLDTNLGETLLSLQNELDAVQRELNEALKQIASEFKKKLADEKQYSAKLIQDFNRQSEVLLQVAAESAFEIVVAAQKRISESLQRISEDIRTRTMDASNETLSTINSVVEELKQIFANIETELNKTYLELRDTLASIMNQSRQLNEEFAKLVSSHFESTVRLTGSMAEDVESWENEAKGVLESASETVVNQLRQISALDKSYTEGIVNILASYIEKSTTLFNREYKTIRDKITSLRTAFENFVNGARDSILELLQNQSEFDITHLENTNQSLNKAFEQTISKTRSKLKKRVGRITEEVGTILRTEANELAVLVTNTDDRLKSAIGSVISSVATRNELVLASAQKFAEEFQNSFGVQLNEILNRFTSEITNQVSATKSLYEELNARLDERLAASVSTISTHAERVEQDIQETIDDQVNKMNRHAEGIRKEFHEHVEDITRQFLSLVQGIETTFNGFLANQVLEVQEMVNSTQLAFKDALRQEIELLQDDSLKLQQEYASEIGQKIDKVAKSAVSAKKALEGLTVTKKEQITKGLQETLARLESALTNIESGLRDIESTTLVQMSEALTQFSHEFSTSIENAHENILIHFENVVESLLGDVKKGTSLAKKAADSFILEQTEFKQRQLSSASERLDALAIETVNSTFGDLENQFSSLSTLESENVKLQNQARDDAINAINSRRAEAIESLETAATWVESAMSNIMASITNLENKLSNEITVIQQKLAKASSEISEEILTKDAEHLVEFDTSASNLIKEFENKIKNHIMTFKENVTEQFERASGRVSELQRSIANVVEENLNQSVLSSEQIQEQVKTRIERASTNLQSSINSAIEMFKSFFQKVQNRFLQNHKEILSTIMNTFVESNAKTASRFETAGLGFKRQLSSSRYELFEAIRKELAIARQQIQDNTSETNNILTKETSALEKKRNDALMHFGSSVDSLVRGWQSTTKEDIVMFKESLKQKMDTLASTAKRTSETVAEIRKASNLLQEIPKNSWYLTGQNEMCSHIYDMANRAKTSILISVSNISCLDLKKLAKVKYPIRKVLIIPWDKEFEQAIDLPGWRIWKLAAPPYLAVRDDEEIIIGGISTEENPLAIVSTDKGFLQLYHDILGPKLISRRRKS